MDYKAFSICAALACFLTSPCSAAADMPANATSGFQTGSWWLNAGFLSYHFPKSGLAFNNANPGLGLEYRQSPELSWAAGGFYNSDWNNSRYAGAYWLPLRTAGWRWGAFAGVIDGYPQMQDGRAFPFAAPVLAWEGARWGVSGSLLPDYDNRLHGALTLQVKVKLGP